MCIRDRGWSAGAGGAKRRAPRTARRDEGAGARRREEQDQRLVPAPHGGGGSGSSVASYENYAKEKNLEMREFKKSQSLASTALM